MDVVTGLACGRSAIRTYFDHASLEIGVTQFRKFRVIPSPRLVAEALVRPVGGVSETLTCRHRDRRVDGVALTAAARFEPGSTVLTMTGSTTVPVSWPPNAWRDLAVPDLASQARTFESS